MKKQIKKIKAALFDVVLYHGGAGTDRGVRLETQFDGELDIDILILAFNKAIELVPVVKCKFVVGRFYYHWEMIQNFDIRNYFTLTNDYDVAENFLLDAIDCETSPQIKVLVYRNKGKDNLRLFMTHLCFDGTALLSFSALVSQYYSGLKQDENYVVKNFNHNYSRELWPLFKNFSIKQRFNFIFSKPKHSVVDISKCFFRDNPSIERKKVFIKKTIEEEVFIKLKNKSKELGVKINDVFFTAFIRVLYDISVIDISRLSVCCSLDLRGYMKNKEEVGFSNLSSHLLFTLSKIEGESFEETLFRVKEEITITKSEYSCMIGMELLRFGPFFLRMPYLKEETIKYIKSTSLSGISNIGILSKDDFMFTGLNVTDIFIGASLRKVPQTFISLCTINNHINITSLLFGTEKEIENEKRNLDMFIESIKKFVL